MSTIDAFADDLLHRMLILSPNLAAEMGVMQVGAHALPQNAMVDFSDAASDARDAMIAEAAAALPQFGKSLSGEDAITFRVLQYLLEDGMYSDFRGRAGHRFVSNPYPLNHLSGFHPTVLMMLSRDHVLRGPEDVEAYLARLEALPAACVGAMDALKARSAQGICAPRFTLEKSLADVKSFISVSVGSNVLMTSFSQKLKHTALPDVQTKTADVMRLFEAAVYPAYDGLIEALEDALALARETDGFWSLPNGDDYYAWLARAHTTTDCSPDDLYETGLDEMRRVQAAIYARFASLGIRGDTIAVLYAQISEAPRFRYAGDEKGREELWSDAQRLMRGFESGAASLFRMHPRGALELVQVPRELEKSLHTHYTPPSADGVRPGCFSINLEATLGNPRWELATLCAHEGVPGHHTQLALAQELPIRSAFRRTVVFNAYIEGWAKYAETIPEAHGLQDDPLEQLGRLRAELYSSVNLAMDTGIHAKRWTFDAAREFFQYNTGVSREFAEAIVERSFISPGQLCSYKTGMMSFLAARERFRVARGADFDIRDFHDSVLGHGALPLRVLDDVVAAVLASSNSASPTGSFP